MQAKEEEKEDREEEVLRRRRCHLLWEEEEAEAEAEVKEAEAEEEVESIKTIYIYEKTYIYKYSYILTMEYLTFFKNLPSHICYETSAEYRSFIRHTFCFDPLKTTTYGDMVSHDLTDLDEESKDELTFDQEQEKRCMDILFEKTKDHPVFHELYTLAAACVFSTDPSIGHAVICCYDMFHLYYTCVHLFLHGGDVKNCSEYKMLHLYLTRK